MPRIQFKGQSKPPDGPVLRNWNIPRMIVSPKDKSMTKTNLFSFNPKLKPKDLLKSINKTYKDTPYSFPKTYINQKEEALCNKRTKKLSAQQKFIADFMRPGNPTKGILIYHGLGSGKTITGIILSEALKGRHTGLPKKKPETSISRSSSRGSDFNILRGGRSTSRIIVVLPLALIDTWKKEIKSWGPRQVLINGIPQNYGTLKENENVEIKKREMRANEKRMKEIIAEGGGKTQEYVKLDKANKAKQRWLDNDKKKRTEGRLIKTYEIISHQRFLNLLMKRNEADGTYVEGEIFDRDKENPLRKPNTLLIIDEIQRLVSEKGSSYQKLLYALKYHSSPDLKVALLTATPIYDKPFEAALTINLLRPRIPFPAVKERFEELFVKKNKNGVAKGSKNDDLFRYLCAGYVSYYSGGNPRAFPFKTIVNMEHRMNGYQENAYKQILMGELQKAVKDKQKPDMLLDFMDGNDADDKKESMNVFMLSQMYCNVALPGVDEEMRKLLDTRAGKRAYKDPGESAAMKTKAEIVSVGLENLQREIESKYNGSSTLGETLAHLSRYSEKYANIIRLTHASPGPVFIFSNFLDYGINAIARIFSGLKWERWNQGMTKKSGKNKLRYAIWSSETAGGKKGQEYASVLQDVFNSYENKDGSIIKVILGTRSIMEGVSFKNVRQAHITDPWWNEARIQQIAARAVRNCSHTSLPPQDRSVVIYKHMSAYRTGIEDQGDIIKELKRLNAGGDLMRSFEQRTIEQYMYGKASEKLRLTHTFQNLLKESAVDCGINKYGNLVRLDEIYEPDYLGGTSRGSGSSRSSGNSVKYILTYLDPSTDIPYAREDVGVKQISKRDMILNVNGYMNNLDRESSFVFRELGQSRKTGLLKMERNTLNKVESGLIIKETIKCNTSKNNLMNETGSKEAKDHLMNLYRNNILIPEISRMIKTGELKRRLQSFINSNNRTPKMKDADGNVIYKGSMAALRNKAKAIVMKKKYKTPHEKLVRDLIYKYEIYGVEHEEQLMDLPDSYLKKEIYEEEQRLLREGLPVPITLSENSAEIKKGK